MNKGILIGVTILVIIAAGLVTLFAYLTDTNRVNAAAHRIADFDLPRGYLTDYVIDVAGYTFAAYKSADEQSHLAFVEIPAGIIPDDEVIEGHVYGGWSRHSQRTATVLSTEERTVRGQPATLTISERVNGEGRLYRSAYMVFEGRDGTAVLVINQPATQWDAEAVDTFIESIE